MVKRARSTIFQKDDLLLTPCARAGGQWHHWRCQACAIEHKFEHDCSLLMLPLDMSRKTGYIIDQLSMLSRTGAQTRFTKPDRFRCWLSLLLTTALGRLRGTEEVCCACKYTSDLSSTGS